MKLIFFWTLILSLLTVHALPPIPEHAATMNLFKPPPKLPILFYRLIKKLRLMPVLHHFWPKHMTSGLFQTLVADHYLDKILVSKYVVMHTRPSLDDLRLISSIQEMFQGTKLETSYQNYYDILLERMLTDARWESEKALDILFNLPGHNQFRLLQRTLELFFDKRNVERIAFQLTKNPTFEDYDYVYNLKTQYAFRGTDINQGLSLLFHRLSKGLGDSLNTFYNFLKALPGIQSEEFRYILKKYLHRPIIVVKAAHLFFEPTERDILFLSKMYVASGMKKDQETIASVTQILMNRFGRTSINPSSIAKLVLRNRFMNSFEYTLSFPYVSNDLGMVNRMARAVKHPSKENLELTQYYLNRLPPNSELRSHYQEVLLLLNSKTAARPT